MPLRLQMSELSAQHLSLGCWGGLLGEVEVKTPESAPGTRRPPKPESPLWGSVPRAPMSHGLERAAVIFFSHKYIALK
jgi:hypothetical protein